MPKQPLESLAQCLQYLKEGALLVSFEQGERRWFWQKGEMVMVHTSHANYPLSLADFCDLFAQVSFYLYEGALPKLEIQKEKDEEYYGWYHK